MQISKRFIGLVVVVAIAAGLGAAWAFAQDANTIHACANPHGLLRVVDDPEDCLPAETPLEWNKEGPPGPGGVSFYTVEHTEEVQGELNTWVSADCGPGDYATGGGWSADPWVQIWGSKPHGDPSHPSGWSVHAYVHMTKDFTTWVICADITP